MTKMHKLLFLVINGIALLDLVIGQASSKTAWRANLGTGMQGGVPIPVGHFKVPGKALEIMALKGDLPPEMLSTTTTSTTTTTMSSTTTSTTTTPTTTVTTTPVTTPTPVTKAATQPTVQTTSESSNPSASTKTAEQSLNSQPGEGPEIRKTVVREKNSWPLVSTTTSKDKGMMAVTDPPDIPELHRGMGGLGGAGAGGAGAWQPEPTEFAIHQAISSIYSAANEQAAIRAAVTIFQPTRDPPDNVVNALEHKIAQLRTPPGWAGRLPPPLPWNFDAGRLIEAAYYGHNTAPFLAASTGPMTGGIAAARPGNLPPSRTRSARFESRVPPTRAAPAHAPPRYPDWSPPSNSMTGWVNPFTLLSQSWMNPASSSATGF